jgi:hypothetical protein
MFVFKSWKESILNAELIHQEEENKLKLSTEHPQSYYMTDTILQSGKTNERTQGCGDHGVRGGGGAHPPTFENFRYFPAKTCIFI